MNERKIDFAMESAGKKINTDLPEIIVEADTSLATFPEAGPAGQIEINKVHERHGVGG